jgi:hypothetical protein
MIQRCHNPSACGYEFYGGRGIQVCERWMSFPNFLADMGHVPAGRVIDRIDTNGNYEPGNCRWATRKQNDRNKRDTTFITHRGVTKPLADWAEERGIPRRTLYFRYVWYGWSAEDAIERPVQKHRKAA